MLEALRRRWGAIFALVVVTLAFWLLHHELKQYQLRDILNSLNAISTSRLVLAVALTALSYAILVGYDALGLRYIQHWLGWKQTATAALLGFSVSNSFGSLVGGSSVRLRLYTSWGLSTVEIIKLMLVLTSTFWLGLLSLSAIALTIYPMQLPETIRIPIGSPRMLGVLMGLAVVSYLVFAFWRRKPLAIRNVELLPPSPKMALTQIAIGCCDLTVAATVLFVLLPQSLEIDFGRFLAVYLLALVAATLSHSPGGVGVFELVLIWLLDDSKSQELMGSLLAFRVIYYLIPLLCALAFLTISEIGKNWLRVSRGASTIGKWTKAVAPRLLSVSVFAAGVVLLLSGALPSEETRLRVLQSFMPLPAIEFSHFLGSVIGVLLMVLARGLQRRIHAAYLAAIGLLVCGIGISLVKGIDYEEAGILAVMLMMFWPSREFFYRRGGWLSGSFNVQWVLAIVTVLVCVFWLTLFAHKHVEYSQDLWWRFAFDGDAPRSLRAVTGSIVVVLVLACWKLMSPARVSPPRPSPEDVATAMKLADGHTQTYAHLVGLGDKQILWNETQSAFIMYGAQGNCLITMGDPVGTEDESRELAWKFYELCDVRGRVPVFYQVDADRLSQYVDMGLSLLKLGEEARVPLKQFGLEGGSRKGIRKTCNQAVESGLVFAVERAPQSSELIAQLKSVSDAWLREKTAAEKGFSLGFFDSDYLSRCAIATLRNPQGQLVAFANLWMGSPGTELSIDLMRHIPDAPRSSMEYLFIQLMLWGKAEGFEWFNLGMAPLSGVEQHRLGPLWNRVAGIAFQHGEHFYNFQGLRQYKEKFDPVWRPKYLASPGGWILPVILANVATLIAGGVTKLIKK